MIELDIKIEAGDLYNYNLRHAYCSPSGIMGTVLGVVMAVVAIATKQWIFLIGGIVLLAYLPWTLFLKSRQAAVLNPVFQKPLHYVLDEEGITISQDEVTSTQKWEDMVKAVATGRSIIVYTSRINATIFPKKQLGDKLSDVEACIRENMPAQTVKI